MTFTVEPMLSLGGYDWEAWDDDWTILTKDGSWVAQWEHTRRRHRRRRRDPDPAEQLRRGDTGSRVGRPRIPGCGSG